MRVLATATILNGEIKRLLKGCRKCEIAVAWASVEFDACRLLQKYSKKISRMIVGTHFYQTHPDFIEAFRAHPKVRFITKTDGVFHPKVYFFELANGTWECIVGSPNFTKGGFVGNEELAVLFTSEDEGASDALQSLNTSFLRFWELGSTLTTQELEAYKVAWKRKQAVLGNLKGKFGNPKKHDGDDRGKPPLAVPILTMGWTEFFEKVKTERLTKYGHSMTARLTVIEALNGMLANRPLSDINRLGRRQVAGFEVTGGVDYGFFGSMKGVGYFQHAVNENDEHLSLALDLIPSNGVITREMYLDYIAEYRKAFPNGRDGVPTASRLLAMKRPDLFVCLSSHNRNGLCGAFGITSSVDYEKYWDSIVERIREAAWWTSPQPTDEIEQGVWAARAAFLDSHYYKE